MSNFNKVFLIGNLCADPELRFTGSGTPVANCRIAMNRKYKLDSGETKEEVTYATFVCWRKQAEAIAQHMKKGCSVFVEGRLQSSEWETQDGQKRTKLEVAAENVQYLTWPKKTGEEQPAAQTTGNEADIPF